MERLETRLPGLVLLAPTVHGDARGFFLETYRADAWAAAGVPTEFVQDNHSRSRRGTLRGIHFQTHPGQGKLVRVARGHVLDVVVDLRRGSPSFGEWEGFELDDEHGHQLYIPVGFGHGFCVRSETADFVYKCTNYYDAATEKGIRFDDPDVGIAWPDDIELLYSERDRVAPLLDDVRGRQLWIPVGFGHGFCVLSDEADFVYKCTNYYDAATEKGIRFDDPDVGIAWPDDIELLYSERDRVAPLLADVADGLPFTYRE